ncbi:hypothetical protein PHJA_000234000 [Phtheirospermum japonicum]|uniref:Protein FAR1-RELATED SEQUENCE n=1 Tax=Phtheirospermum japonicum TaxID=374723 RepID=A0A830B1G9_9LAMI|nr:hypothetical protein PHJA_000234000 [Phtheirospermum japonicum]
MYKLRKKWATAFSNDKFSAGLLATSRSENTNMVLKKVGNKTCSLCDFVLNYENVQNNWRINEKVEDTRCRHRFSKVIHCLIMLLMFTHLPYMGCLKLNWLIP